MNLDFLDTQPSTNSPYDNDDWVSERKRDILESFVLAFDPQLQNLPHTHPISVFLSNERLYSGPYADSDAETKRKIAQKALDTGRKSGPQFLQTLRGPRQAYVSGRFQHAFARANLGGPEGMLHAADLGVSPDAINTTDHKLPPDVTQKALDNAGMLSSFARDVSEAIASKNLDTAMVTVFGQKWITFQNDFDAGRQPGDP